MHRAEANMVVCAKAMLNVARKLNEDHGAPFFEGSFYEIVDTSAALRDFARVIGDPRPHGAHRAPHRARGSQGGGGAGAVARETARQARAAVHGRG